MIANTLGVAKIVVVVLAAADVLAENAGDGCYNVLALADDA